MLLVDQFSVAISLKQKHHQNLLKTISSKGNPMSNQEQKTDQKQQGGQQNEKAAPEQLTQEEKQAKQQGGNASPHNQK